MGSSKKVTVGYKYYLGMHLILCHGPADSLRRITVDGRIAWIGVNEGGRVNVANEGLFGGEQREGGVSGACDLEMGRPDQGRNDYLIGQLGADLPAFRGVVGFVMRQAYLGLNPYLKRWGFRLQRIHVRQNGLPQWYDEKAEISTLVPTILDEPWQYQVLPYHSNPGYDNISIPTSGWQGEAVLPFTNSNVWLYPTPPGWPTVDRSVVWIKKTVHNVPAGLVIQARADNGCLLWVNGTYIGASNRDNAPIPSNNNYPVEFTVPASGTYEVVVKAYTEDSTGDQAGNYLSITLADVPNGGDMNPAHIIRECLTDPDWGMGYQDADVDDDAFMAAADKLYTEGMGMSLLWDRQMPIEDFVMEVVKHINASVYVDRSTGKFVLKLIRDDYDKDDLLVIDEDNISKVENATRPTTGELVNSISVVYWDAQTGENASVTVQDQALIQMQGSVVNTTLQFPGFTNATIASKVALRSLRSLSTPLLSCTVYADRTASKLNVGDVFRLTWPDLEIDDLVMRVAALAFGDGKSNTVKITCIEDSFAFPETATVVPDVPGWENPSQPATPSPHRLPFESPYYELVQTLGQSDVDGMLLESPDAALLMAAASAPPGGIQAVVSANAGAGFEDVAALDFCPYATLQTDMDALTTEVTFSDGVDLDLVAVGTIVRIGEEECRVDAIDVGTSTLTVGRGCLDTPPIPHSVGEGIFFWDVYNAVDQTEYVLGETVQVKILPTTGGGALDPSAAPTDSVTFEGRPIRPYPPGDFKINGVSYPVGPLDHTLAFTWVDRDRRQQTSGEIIDHFDPDPIGPEAGTTYRLRAIKDGITLVHDEEPVSSGVTWEPEETATYTVMIDAVRGGRYSYRPARHTFDYLADLPDDVMAGRILDKLVHWWALNETSGTTFKDSHGGMDLTLFNNASTGVTYSRASLRTGGPTCVQFSGNGGAFQWGNPEWWVKQLDVSLVAWSKPMEANYANNRPLVCDSPASDSSEAINQRLQWWYGNTAGTANLMGAFWEYGVGTNYTPPNGNTVHDTAAHMFSFTRVGATSTVAYSRDGVPDGGGAYATAPTGGNSVDSRFSLGNVPANSANSGNADNNPVRADMQDVQAYRTPLTNDELDWLYNGGAGRSYADIWTLSTRTRLWTPQQLGRKVVWFKSDHEDNHESVAGYVDRVANLTGFPAGTPYSNAAANQFRNDLTTLNGRKVLTGNGSTNCNGHFVFPNTKYRWKAVNGSTIVYVGKAATAKPSGSAQTLDLLQTRDGSNGHLHGIYCNDSTGGQAVTNGGRRLTGDSYASSTASIVRTNWNIIGCTNNYADGTSRIKLNGGTEAVSGVVYTTGVTSTADKGDNFGVGGQAYGTSERSLNSEFAEVLVIDGLLTATEWEKLEGYLAHQWGLTANLPSGHPYKSSPPTI